MNKNMDSLEFFAENPISLLRGASALLALISRDLRTQTGIDKDLADGITLIECSMYYAIEQIKKGYINDNENS